MSQSPQQAYGGWLYYECTKGHTVVLNDEWPDALQKPCTYRKKKDSPPCAAPSKLLVLRERKPKGTP